MRKLVKVKKTSEVGWAIDWFKGFYLLRCEDQYKFIHPNDIVILEKEPYEIRHLKEQMSELIYVLAVVLNCKIDDEKFANYILDTINITMEEYLEIMKLGPWTFD